MRQILASLLILATFFGAMPLAAAPLVQHKFEPQLLWAGWCPHPMPVQASYTLTLEGLDDKDSIEAATKLLKAIDGVETVAIDTEKNIATITLKAGKTLSEDALKAAFKDTKYTFKDLAKAK